MEQQELTLDIYIISRLTHIYYAKELRKLGITMGQFPFLMGIHEEKGISQEQLSGKLQISKSTTAVMIGQLTGCGLVKRRVNLSDRRNFCLELTSKGRALIPEIEKIIQTCHARLTDGFTDGEKKILEELLRRSRKKAETL